MPRVPIDVATYLLSEKRNEFIRSKRLKVNVLLIPNISLKRTNLHRDTVEARELNQIITVPSTRWRCPGRKA